MSAPSQMFSDLPDDTAPINKMLPKELLLRVFSFLDVVSLCRSAQVITLCLKPPFIVSFFL